MSALDCLYCNILVAGDINKAHTREGEEREVEETRSPLMAQLAMEGEGKEKRNGDTILKAPSLTSAAFLPKEPGCFICLREESSYQASPILLQKLTIVFGRTP